MFKLMLHDTGKFKQLCLSSLSSWNKSQCTQAQCTKSGVTVYVVRIIGSYQLLYLCICSDGGDQQSVATWRSVCCLHVLEDFLTPGRNTGR